jgi:fructose-specific phosphotransferase system IIC component
MLVNFIIMALSVLRLPSRNPALAQAMRVLPSRALQIAVAGTAVVLLSILLAVHTWRDLHTDVAVWYARSTPVWVIVMIIGSAIYWRETRALARRGGDLDAITSVLPPE